MKMSGFVKHRDTCRLCGSKNIELVLKLVATPIGDAYVSKEHLNEKQVCYPVELFLCKDCGLAQLPGVLDPDAVYCDYIYHTSDSLGLVQHFQKYVDEVFNYVNPPKNSLVIDIGSNDGSLLKFFKDKGMRVLGIDPAREIANVATKCGIETLPTFFNSEIAQKIRRERGSAYIITINNAFANIDDLSNLIKGVKLLLDAEGIFVFETGYFVDLTQKTIFDNIYHEHISYFTVKPLRIFFKNTGLELIDVKRIASKGGSIRCIVQLASGSREESQSINGLLKLEAGLKIHNSEIIKEFGNKLNNIKNELLKIVKDLKAKGKKIAGYGASVGVTTVLYNFDLNKELLDFIVDDNASRQNLYSPGLYIPVLSPKGLIEQKIDYVIILAWQYAEPIIKNNQEYLDKGGHFIKFLPKVEII